jgi:gluconolactonase
MVEIEALRVIADGRDHPEGVAVGPDGCLYAGGEAGQVYRVDPEGGHVEQIAATGGFLLGVALDAAGVIYACDVARKEVLRIGLDGDVETYCDCASGVRFTAPNWLAFEQDGSLLVSDSGSDSFEVIDGRMVRVPPGGGDGEALDLGRPAHTPNGFAVAPDGSAYVVETYSPRLSRLTDDGLETILELPQTAPDGVALTADGGIVISCYYPYKLLYVPPDELRACVLLADTAGLRLPNPTNVAFFGAELTRLAIAAHGGLFLAAIDLPFAGAPVHRPRLQA